jgi:predicted HTH transcriptional regulator
LSNTACLDWRDYAFLIYWIEDWTLEIKWTDLIIEKKKEWNQPFLFKLSKDISIDIDVQSLEYKWKNIVIFIVPSASDKPITFKHISYIRVWTATPLLDKYPDKQRKIWNNIYNKNFEKQIALPW